jgi:hypothetical protein
MTTSTPSIPTLPSIGPWAGRLFGSLAALLLIVLAILAR